MNKHRRLIVVLIAAIFFISSFIGGIYIGILRGIPFVRKESRWSIGVYVGESPFTVFSPGNIKNPILTAKDVTDADARFVADPFMVNENNTWYMFLEIFNKRTNQGDIALATSNDGFDWTYKRIVLDEPFHMTYPYIFKYKNEYYMVPETHVTNSIRLYRAAKFPTKWSFVGTVLEGHPYRDSSLILFDDRWWMFTATTLNDTLRLYYADELMGPWIEHAQSPIIEGDANIARPGGRVIVVNGKVVRYTQDGDPTYGNQVRAFEITHVRFTSIPRLQ